MVRHGLLKSSATSGSDENPPALPKKWMLLAGWIHYLAFDLLVGIWEARDARERGIGHLFVVPCLVLTFLFGPAGWLLYLGVRSPAAGIARHADRDST